MIDVLIYNDELIVELLFIIVLPLTINELLIEVLLFNIIIPETYNELLIVVLFNIAQNFQMLSEMSVNDLATIGYTLGFGENVDNHRSVAWNAAATDKNGNGFTNNRVFAQNSSFSFSSPYVTGVKYVSPACRYQTSMQVVIARGLTPVKILFRLRLQKFVPG